MTKRAYNFNAGPAALPYEVLLQAQEEFVEYEGIGMSIMEISHRSKQYEQLNDETQTILRRLVGIPDSYRILFVQGGASTQFAMIPMNFVREGQVSSFVQTGTWADKAIEEAMLFSDVHIAASTKDSKYSKVPELADIEVHPDAAYLHITSNETIGGIQFPSFPTIKDVPVIADMSSDILCRPLDINQFSMIYAGAQKNLGPSGVTLVIMHESLLADIPKNIPTMLRYDTHASNNSLYNTPPVYSVYMVNLVLKWIESNGGLAAMEERNRTKAQLIYNAIDQSSGFYRGVADHGSRSIMNITFQVSDAELEKKFIKEAEQAGFVGLKGHRSVGGLRASAYNAVPYESCKALADFMAEFQRANG